MVKDRRRFCASPELTQQAKELLLLRLVHNLAHDLHQLLVLLHFCLAVSLGDTHLHNRRIRSARLLHRRAALLRRLQGGDRVIKPRQVGQVHPWKHVRTDGLRVFNRARLLPDSLVLVGFVWRFVLELFEVEVAFCRFLVFKLDFFNLEHIVVQSSGLPCLFICLQVLLRHLTDSALNLRRFVAEHLRDCNLALGSSGFIRLSLILVDELRHEAVGRRLRFGALLTAVHEAEANDALLQVLRLVRAVVGRLCRFDVVIV